jgi:hypothetical protein
MERKRKKHNFYILQEKQNNSKIGIKYCKNSEKRNRKMEEYMLHFPI